MYCALPKTIIKLEQFSYNDHQPHGNLEDSILPLQFYIEQ